MSKFAFARSPSIFQQQRGSKAQNIAKGMNIWLVYSTSGITASKKSLLRPQNGGHFENFEILNAASFWPEMWKDRPKLYQKSIFHYDDVIDDVNGWPLNRPSIFLINEIRTCFVITKKWTEISSLNFLYRGIIGLWRYSHKSAHKSVFITSLLASGGHKVGQIWNYYISINISPRRSIKRSKYRQSAWLSCWHIQLPVRLLQPQNGGHFFNFEIFKIVSFWHQLWEDRIKLCKKRIFMVMTTLMASQDDLEVALYIHI